MQRRLNCNKYLLQNINLILRSKFGRNFVATQDDATDGQDQGLAIVLKGIGRVSFPWHQQAQAHHLVVNGVKGFGRFSFPWHQQAQAQHFVITGAGLELRR